MSLLKPIKLNLGCGPCSAEGWLNFDWGALPLLSKMKRLRRLLIKSGILPEGYNLEWPEIKLVDIRRRLPLRDNSVSFIYISHVLEHFELWESASIIRECHRVLSPGGKIRTVVPDLHVICTNYLRDLNAGISRPARIASRTIWGFNKDEKPRGIAGKIMLEFIRPHHWAFDANEMDSHLRQGGFSRVERSSYREGDFPDINILDLEIHKPLSLYMEATK